MNRLARPLFSARSAVAVLLVTHLLAVLILAASPRLHHWVHPGTDDDDHDCAVVLFLHGGGAAGPAPLILPMPLGQLAVFVLSASTAAFVPSVFAANRVFEHAPPFPKRK